MYNRINLKIFTDSAMLEPTGNNVVDIPTLKQDCGHDENKQRTTNQSRLTNPLPSHETSQTVPESSTSLQTPRNPNYPNLSSGLVYDNQSSNVLKESYPSKLHPPVRKQTNLAESDPVSFVQLLTDRLEKVRESRGKVEKLMSLVNQVDGKLCIESGHTSVSVSASHELFSSTVVGHNPSLQSNDSNWCQLDTTIISPMNPPVNETNSIPLTQHAIHPSLTDDAKQLTNKSQDAQEILDDHCSRIWADELERDKKRCRRQLSDCSRTSANQLSSVTPYPILSDTLVRSMHASLVRNTTDYELMKPSSGRCKTTATARSTVTCFSNTSNNNRTSVSDSSHRRRHAAGGYRGMNRPNKSDVRSTASWDSGVVTSNYEMKNLHLTDTDGDNDYFDAETSSILEAASLQALSSSTTELALVNGERLERKQQQSGHFYEQPSYIQGFNSNSAYGPTCQHCANKISCEWHRLRHCVHHCSTQPGANEHLSSQLPIMSNYICSHQSVDKSMPSSSCHSQSFPTASDTSSTFDSGISSAYDQLPLRKQTSARENRSQSLHNWQ
ncbi:unnamed protein product [Heterobilharzia americana]|nr:unnamed protein product [Heterobilharzia americana]